MTFELPNNTIVHIVSVNPRREKHGDDNVPAIDLKMRLEVSNNALSMFDGSLKSSLYLSEPTAEQPELDGVEPVSDMPTLRFPALKTLRWDAELTGYRVVIDHGLGGQSNLVLPDCTLNNFSLELQQGGTVIIAWRLQCNHVTEREIGKLCLLIDEDVEAWLIGPDSDAPELDTAVDLSPVQDATELFLEAQQKPRKKARKPTKAAADAELSME